MEDLKQIQEFFSKPLDEGTLDQGEIAIYIGNDDAGTTHIFKRGKGYYGYNDEFDFEAKDRADLEQKLKSYGYELLAGSLDEASKEEENEFHTKLDKLVHKTFGKRKDEMEEAKLTEAYVPQNIKEFAKRKGVSRLVNTVAGWAEKVGARITGGTAIGKYYNTLILDMGYQTSDIRINCDEETVELYDEPIYSFADFKRVFMEEETRKQAEHDEETLSREQGLEEGASSEEKRIAMRAIRSIAKYRGVSEDEARNDLIRAAKELGNLKEEEGYSQFLKDDPEHPGGKTKGLTPDVMNKILMRVVQDIEESRPGLWDNIRAKRERGEKPSRKGSKAYKSAVKAGKEINKAKD